MECVLCQYRLMNCHSNRDAPHRFCGGAFSFSGGGGPRWRRCVGPRRGSCGRGGRGVGDGGGDVGGLAESGGPSVEEHVEGAERNGGPGCGGLVGSQVFAVERAVDGVGDDLELLELGEGFGAGDDVVFGGVRLRL